MVTDHKRMYRHNIAPMAPRPARSLHHTLMRPMTSDQHTHTPVSPAQTTSQPRIIQLPQTARTLLAISQVVQSVISLVSLPRTCRSLCQVPTLHNQFTARKLAILGHVENIGNANSNFNYLGQFMMEAYSRLMDLAPPTLSVISTQSTRSTSGPTPFHNQTSLENSHQLQTKTMAPR
jgi:hypothetical protein